ncbi:hypothetical protein R1sor_021589 [Riccia sorocarpa]|uniref:RING-type domain-containing protein n=1 Tax=Riccia sorocarpa TaxID=122646 RepID=A0ABD3GHI3_9MARC
MDTSPAATTEKVQPSGDVVEDPGEGDKEDWEEEEFILPLEYFVDECKLPSFGIHPAELPKNLVSDEQLVNCFGLKAGKNGRNGHRWDLLKLIPPADVLSLVQVIDGHEKPINGTIGIIFPRALYAERILGQKINWAAFAHDKLKNQIKAQKTRKLPKPMGPPCIRTPRVYTPPPGLTFGDSDVLIDTVREPPSQEDSVADAKDKGKLTELQFRAMPTRSVLKSEACGFASLTACSDLSGQGGGNPMSFIQIGSIEVLKLEVKKQEEKKRSITDSLSQSRDTLLECRKSLGSFTDTVEKCEALLTSEVKTRQELFKKESELTKRNKEVVMLLEPDDEFDENDAEEVERLDELEREGEDLAVKISEVLDTIAASEANEKSLSEQIDAARRSGVETEAKILKVTNEIKAKEKTLAQVEDDVGVLEKELVFLEQYFSEPCPTLCPRYVLTPTELTRTVFRLTSCPACNLGFHCFNFVPTSCGHAYHPPCVVPLLAKAHTEHPKCLACGERLHPDWIETWGMQVNTVHKAKLEEGLGLAKQKLAFEEGLRELYHDDPARIVERRVSEKATTTSYCGLYTVQLVLRRCLERYVCFADGLLIMEQVEHDLKASIAASKVRRHLWTSSGGEGQTSQPKTPTSAPASTNVQQLKHVKIEDEKETVGKSIASKKRKGSTAARASRGQGSSTPTSQVNTLGLKSRDRSGHTCVSPGAEKHMFHFFVQTAEEDYILEVWDKAGQSLFNISGQEFFETFGHDIARLHQFVYNHLSENSWAITVIGKPSARGYMRAVFFSRAELTSPALPVESAAGHVGVIKVRDRLRGKKLSEAPCTSGSRPRASLVAMLGLQSRLNDVQNDIAEAIAALKLEQEEEFVDSSCDWVDT